MAMQWTEDLGTGVREIDEQHKELFSRFNQLYQACSEGRGKEEVLRLLQFLQDYVKEHFSAEERLQLRNGYPQFTDHKSEHSRFMTEVERLAREFQSEGATLPLVIKTNQTLSSWLLQHITISDMAFARYLREQ